MIETDHMWNKIFEPNILQIHYSILNISGYKPTRSLVTVDEYIMIFLI